MRRFAERTPCRELPRGDWDGYHERSRRKHAKDQQQEPTVADEKTSGGATASPKPAGDYSFPLPPRGELPPPTSEARGQVVRSRASDFWALMGCNAIVFASSVCIMVLELTASRLIAAYLGSSLYTWTSVIGVVLAGISLGNYLGGWLADRFDPRRTLGWLFFVSGMFTFSVLFLNGMAAQEARWEWVPWRWWVMLVVAFVFFLPALALGTISPVTASMALKRSLKTGVTVGNIYAWGAMGSIAGTFLAGFWLIGAYGTNTIVCVTAIALLLMGFLVASGQWVFRASLLFGALQLVGWIGLAATATDERMASLSRAYAGVRYLFSDEREKKQDEWATWGGSVGRAVHDLGMKLSLRRDNPNEYNDESDYYSIVVANGYSDEGDPVKELRLDYLIHSYYSDDDPTKLYYDYDRVYAAITERAAATWNRKVEVTLPVVPAPNDLREALPASMQFDAANKRLTLTGAMETGEMRRLLSVGPQADFWQAVFKLWESTHTNWQQAIGDEGLATAPLEKMPEGFEFPDDLGPRVHYDTILKCIVCRSPFTLEEAVRILAQGEYAGYVKGVYELYEKSRSVSTLFIGGGGFVFPRWIEAKFPHHPLIHVAEIDPAVKLAVERELGLKTEYGPPEEGKTWVETHIGDARNFVDDQLRANQRRKVRNEPPVTYDFAYGDAFNDLSVPWHLTTREFSQKVRDLLTPGEGVFLVNIIDIYPRAQSPGEKDKVGKGETRFIGRIPNGLTRGETPADQWVAARSPFKQLEIKAHLSGRSFDLRYTGVMSKETKEALQELSRAGKSDDKDSGVLYRSAIAELHQQTNKRKYHESRPPAGLLPTDIDAWDWVTCAAPWDNMQIYKHGDDGYIYGFRGVMPEVTRDALLKLAPGDKKFTAVIDDLHQKSHREQVGRFLGCYVNTAREVFPYVYVFSSNEDAPSDVRDTFVVACAMKKLNLEDLVTSGGHWTGAAFAWTEQDDQGKPQDGGEMRSVLELSRHELLTDNYAPVDNMLAPVFISRSDD
jgi:hypothetical protein